MGVWKSEILKIDMFFVSGQTEPYCLEDTRMRATGRPLCGLQVRGEEAKRREVVNQTVGRKVRKMLYFFQKIFAYIKKR